MFIKKLSPKIWITFLTLILIVVVLLLALPYIYKLPFFNSNKPNELKYSISNPTLAQKIQPSLDLNSLSNKSLPSENTLVIPKIGVDSKIVQGNSLDVLNKEEGVWQEPSSSTPTTKGNMVIAGHRFQYLPPNTHTFYNLDQVSSGDLILVYWKNQEGKMQDFYYQVYATKTVEPNETFIRDFDTSLDGQITLYTCGPEVGQNSKRLVVVAKLVVEKQN